MWSLDQDEQEKRRIEAESLVKRRGRWSLIGLAAALLAWIGCVEVPIAAELLILLAAGAVAVWAFQRLARPFGARALVALVAFVVASYVGLVSTQLLRGVASGQGASEHRAMSSAQFQFVGGYRGINCPTAERISMLRQKGALGDNTFLMMSLQEPDVSRLRQQLQSQLEWGEPASAVDPEFLDTWRLVPTPDWWQPENQAGEAAEISFWRGDSGLVFLAYDPVQGTVWIWEHVSTPQSRELVRQLSESSDE